MNSEIVFFALVHCVGICRFFSYALCEGDFFFIIYGQILYDFFPPYIIPYIIICTMEWSMGRIDAFY